MEACPQRKFDLVVQRKEGRITSYHILKRPKALRKNTFDIPMFKFQNGLKQKISNFWLFWDKKVCGSLIPQKYANIFLDIVSPVNNADILAPELVGGQSDMVVRQVCHTF